MLHATGGGRSKVALETLTMADSLYVSSHFLIGRQGDQHQLVPLHRKAFHAGVSEWPYEGEMTPNVNRFAVGIELANHLRLVPDATRAGAFRYKIRGTWYRYHGPAPVAAELEYDNGHKVQAWWEPYPKVQIDSLIKLLARLKKIITPDAALLDVFGHEESAMDLGRKIDPGPRFPWDCIERLHPRRTSCNLILSENLP